MKHFIYNLETEGYINRFLTAGTFCKPGEYAKATLSGTVNEWLEKGFSVYENPCRREMIGQRTGVLPEYVDLSEYGLGAEVEVFGCRRQVELYVPFGNQGVDFSEFYFNPTYLRTYCYAGLFAQEEERAEFELQTCGGFTLWINGQLVEDFIPFTRNMVKRRRVSAALCRGMNKIVVCLEDLAERDTDYHYQIRYLGAQDIGIRVPVKEETDTETIRRAEQALSDMYFDKEAYMSESVYLNLEAFTSVPVKMLLTPDRGFGQRQYIIQPGQKGMTLFHADEGPSNFYFFRLEIMVSGLVMSKVIGTYSFNTRFMKYQEDSYEERKQRIRKIIRDSDEMSDYRAIIRMDEGETPDNLEKILSCHLGWVNEKRDCSDFRLIILVYMYVRFSGRFSEKLRKDVEDAMAGYRYWADEPGDDVMWFFSENHALMFHICQYFAGKSMPERMFTCSGLTGAQAARKAEGLLDAWFESFFA